MKEYLLGISKDLEIIWINDGSSDCSEKEFEKLLSENMFSTKVIHFSRNFGKEAVMYAGLNEASGKYTAIIDADLQQDPKYILEMKKILDENDDVDVVAASPANRMESKSVAKIKGFFYKIMSKFSGLDMSESASDFRVFRRNVLEAMISLSENQRFTKGIFAWVGFNTQYIKYEVKERANGKTKWGFKNLVKYAIDGITNFSDRPLQFITQFGTFLFIIGIASTIFLMVTSVISKKAYSESIWMITAMSVLVGIVLICNGVIGYYLYKLFLETKERPKYIIKEKREEKNEIIDA